MLRCSRHAGGSHVGAPGSGPLVIVKQLKFKYTQPITQNLHRGRDARAQKIRETLTSTSKCVDPKKSVPSPTDRNQMT